MATDKLKIYKGACIKAGTRILGSLTEDVDRRHWLDEVWDDGGVDYCLEAGQWNFATRSTMLSYDSAIEPAFGWKRAFVKPSDWILTTAVASDEFYRQPLLQYTDEGGVLYAELADIYVKYVSNADGFGMDYALWPSSFTEYVKAYFAYQIAPKLSGGEEQREALQKEMTSLLRMAKNRNQIGLPTKFPAQGSWNSSRGGRHTNRDRGSSRNFTG